MNQELSNRDIDRIAASMLKQIENRDTGYIARSTINGNFHLLNKGLETKATIVAVEEIRTIAENAQAGMNPMGKVTDLAELNTKPKRNNDSYFRLDTVDDNGNPYIWRYDQALNKWINTFQIVYNKNAATRDDLQLLEKTALARKKNFIEDISLWSYNSSSPSLTVFIPDFINDIKIKPKRSLLLNGIPRKIYIGAVETYGIPDSYQIVLYIQTAVGYDRYTGSTNSLGWLDVDTQFAVFSFELTKTPPKSVSLAATYESGGLRENLIKSADNEFVLNSTGIISTSLHPYSVMDPIAREGSTRIFSPQIAQDGILQSINIYGCRTGIAKVYSLSRVGNKYQIEQKLSVQTKGGIENYNISLPVKVGEFIAIYTNFPTYIQEGADGGGTLYYQGDIEGVGSFSASLANTIDFIDYSFEPDILMNSIRNINTPRVLPKSNSYKNKTILGKPLYIPDPYGYNQPLHPCVMYFENGFGGFKYWMVQTPLPQGAAMYIDRYENPCIYCCNDGISWETPKGFTNPLDDITQEIINVRGYHSDPWFVFNEMTNKLECWYRLTINGSTYIPTIVYRRVSSDGVNWSDKEEMFRFTTAESIERSQSMVRVNGKYTQWLCTGHGFYTNTSVDGKVWSAPVLCIGLKNPWHAEVKQVNGKFYFLGYYNPEEVLRVAESVDGINWTNETIVMKPKLATFYSNRFYKSSMLFDGTWKLYFTADCGKWHIGYAEGETPYQFTVIDGNYELGDTYREKQEVLINNSVQNSFLGLSESGYKLGFSELEKALYIQTPEGERHILKRLS